MRTRTSRITNQEPINISKLIALCLFLMVLFLVFLNNKAANRIQKVELDNFYLKDSLKLKTSIVAKEDSAYRHWIAHPGLRVFVKNDMIKTTH